MSDPPVRLQVLITRLARTNRGREWGEISGWCEVIRSKIIVTPIIENHNGLTSPGQQVGGWRTGEFPHLNIAIIQHSDLDKYHDTLNIRIIRLDPGLGKVESTIG